ncbi:MAG TPA: hypothetical protein PLX65_14485, partial [Accumulibacter sp.]|nr:hypothetical protein [Accumulibacter sp.]
GKLLEHEGQFQHFAIQVFQGFQFHRVFSSALKSGVYFCLRFPGRASVDEINTPSRRALPILKARRRIVDNLDVRSNLLGHLWRQIEHGGLVRPHFLGVLRERLPQLHHGQFPFAFTL